MKPYKLVNDGKPISAENKLPLQKHGVADEAGKQAPLREPRKFEIVATKAGWDVFDVEENYPTGTFSRIGSTQHTKAQAEDMLKRYLQDSQKSEQDRGIRDWK